MQFHSGPIFAVDVINIALVRSETHTITKFGLKKLETPLYVRCEKYCDILNRLGVDKRVWLTDRETHEQTEERTEMLIANVALKYTISGQPLDYNVPR